MDDRKQNCAWPTIYKGYITGQVGSCVLFDSFRKDTLCQLLPEGYRLARQSVAPSGHHPVYWCFNLNQRQVGTPLPFLCLNYHEFALVIPYVMCTVESGQIGAFAPTLYLNSPLGVLGGKIIWQLNKKWKRCRLNTASFTDSQINMSVKRLLHSDEILNASFEKKGLAIPYQQSENFLKIKPMLDQPLLSSGWRGYRTSDFVLDYQNLHIQPVDGIIHTGDFLMGLQNLVRKITSIDQSPLGGFYFNLPWKLKLPVK